MMKKVLIIGGGFTGCTMANMLKDKFDITLIEKEKYLGGGCRTFFYKGHPYTYGPRHLNVQKKNQDVWEYLNKYMDLRLLRHKVCTLPSNEDTFFSYPPHKKELKNMKNYPKIKNEIDNLNFDKKATNFEEYWEGSLGTTLYEGFVKEYSKKMWGIDDNRIIDLDNIPVHKNALRETDNDYFDGEQYTAYPKNLNGYNDYFEECVKGCNVMLNSDIQEYDIKNKRVKLNNEWLKGDIIISTISLDRLFNFQFGELKYRGRDFIKILLPIERVTPEPYYFLYYAGDEPYTRIVEYKLLTGYKSKDTLLVLEIPSNSNKLYPYPIKNEIEKADKYKELLPENCFSIGRMGKYEYCSMDMIIKDCFKIKEQL
jgi:UDP-galactopyranose mutase